MTMTEGACIEPLGLYLLVERAGEKVVRIFFSQQPAERHSPLAEAIGDYLAGRVPCPDAELDPASLTDFQKKIYAIVRSIPRGETLTYGEVANLAGLPGGARAVGRAMASNPFAIIVPCHRVVARSGLGGYRWGRDIKEKLLGMEG